MKSKLLLQLSAGFFVLLFIYVLSYEPIFLYVAFRYQAESSERERKVIQRVVDFYAPVGWLQSNSPSFNYFYKSYSEFWTSLLII